MIRTRFAPSPTGYVHVGSLRAALFPYLFSRKNGGTFILRIEDTDQERLVEGAIENIIRTLNWAGVTIDEGPMLDKNGAIMQKGTSGPYIQSERLPLYKKYAQQLLDSGAAYYAFDSSEELEKMRERQQAFKLLPRYDRVRMKNQFTLSKEDVQKLLDSGAPYTIRMKVPDEGEVTFNDLIRGPVKFNVKEIDDQVLLKSDGFPTYHLAVVVDDHTMGITHVIRGEDWLPSTPKHLLLYKAFGWDAPEHAHMPLLVDKDKQKLSKRKGDVSVESYRDKGYLPEAFVNFLAFLGWNPGDDREIFSLKELGEIFDISAVQKSSAFFNIEKLNWYNKEYIKKLSDEELAKRAEPWLVQAGFAVGDSRLAGAVGLERERITTLAELPEAIKFVFTVPEYAKELLVWRKGTLEEVQKVLPALKEYLTTFSVQDWNKAILEQKVGEWIKEKGYATGSVLWPLRVSLSGQQNSPGPYDIAAVLGKEESLRRLSTALQKVS